MSARREQPSDLPSVARYRVVSCLRTMHCDDCGARLQLMRVERGPLTTRFVCASHDLPEHLVGREVVRVVRGGHVLDVPAAEVRDDDDTRRAL